MFRKNLHVSFILMLITLVSSLQAQTITLNKPTYRTVYDLGLQCPVQVTWTLHRSDIGSSSREPSWTFTPDIPSPLATARHNDYNHSGYDRGHMCPAHDRSISLAAMRSTFTTSNIAPQVPALNRGSWKQTENWCRIAAIQYDSITIIAVPIFLPRDTQYIGHHRLAVPHAFFKAAWLPASDSVIACWFMFNH